MANNNKVEPGPMEDNNLYPSLEDRGPQQVPQQVPVDQEIQRQVLVVQPQFRMDWTTGICGCFADFGTCVFATCCYPCYLCQVASKMRECFCLPVLLFGVSHIAMRTKLRAAYGIQGSICGDCLCVTCCNCLTTCQMDREMNARGTNLL